MAAQDEDMTLEDNITWTRKNAAIYTCKNHNKENIIKNVSRDSDIEGACIFTIECLNEPQLRTQQKYFIVVHLITVNTN